MEQPPKLSEHRTFEEKIDVVKRKLTELMHSEGIRKFVVAGIDDDGYVVALDSEHGSIDLAGLVVMLDERLRASVRRSFCATECNYP